MGGPPCAAPCERFAEHQEHYAKEGVGRLLADYAWNLFNADSVSMASLAA